ncbi:MAG: hypothetical protein HOE95_05935, partial [Flavobacteriales bacterium]|nr:hypothetical protein [Flavobacteriales bacterium]
CLSELDGLHATVGVLIELHRYFDHARSNAFEGLSIFWHPAKLDELQFISYQLFGSDRKLRNVLKRVPKPNNFSWLWYVFQYN